VAKWRASQWLAPCLLALFFGTACARVALPAPVDPVLEAQVMRIAGELRCLVCQNQTVADSQADLAIDLRNQVRSMLQHGKNEEEIASYMAARYGDFVLYRPTVKPGTWLLWFGPAALVLMGLAALVWVLRQRSRMPAENFDSESHSTYN